MKQERINRAQSISKKILSEYIINELKELTIDFGIITITKVEISNDLSYIDIYVSSLKNQDTLTKALAENSHGMQRILWKNIDFLKVPRVRFKYDKSGEDSFEIYTTIQNLDIK